MNSSTLAIHGGTPVRTRPFPVYQTIGREEKQAVMEVMDSGVLSSFLGCWDEDFFGGYRVQKLEREWEAHFEIEHAITFNSATSGIYAAVGASGIGPGDEVIVSPYTMSASAAAALVYGAIDASGGFYRIPVATAWRSPVNVCFQLADNGLVDHFIDEAEAAGMHYLRGHPQLGGLRASLYNAMPESGAAALAKFMIEFLRRWG